MCAETFTAESWPKSGGGVAQHPRHQPVQGAPAPPLPTRWRRLLAQGRTRMADVLPLITMKLLRPFSEVEILRGGFAGLQGFSASHAPFSLSEEKHFLLSGASRGTRPAGRTMKTPHLDVLFPPTYILCFARAWMSPCRDRLGVDVIVSTTEGLEVV